MSSDMEQKAHDQLEGSMHTFDEMCLEIEQRKAYTYELEVWITQMNSDEYCPAIFSKIARGAIESNKRRTDDIKALALEGAANSMPQDYNEGPGFQAGVNHAKSILLSRAALIRREVSG